MAIITKDIKIKLPSTTSALSITASTGVNVFTHDHDKLNHLDYESSGHTGFASSADLENTQSVIEGELQTAIAQEAQTREGADIALDQNKLNKVTLPSANRQVYGKATNGEQAMFDISSTSIPGALLVRDANGNVDVSTPTEPGHAVNKGYIDEIVHTDNISETVIVEHHESTTSSVPPYRSYYVKENAWFIPNITNTYKIEFDGTEYACIPFQWFLNDPALGSHVTTCLGNIELLIDSAAGFIEQELHPEMPFLIAYDRSADGKIEVFSNLFGTHVFKVTETVTEVSRLADKYLWGSDATLYKYDNKQDNNYSRFGIGGPNDLVNQNGALALGHGNKITGDWGVAVGHGNTVSGQDAKAFGTLASASGKSSIAIGLGTSTAAANQIAIGAYNKPQQNTVFEVGNGTAQARANAFAIDTNNNVKVTGNVYVRSNDDSSDGIRLAPISDCDVTNGTYSLKATSDGVDTEYDWIDTTPYSAAEIDSLYESL